MSKSIFITLEGVDGAGKSTHIDFIKNYFDTKKINFYMTREPGGTDLGEKLRRSLLHENMDPLTETILMFAARCEHIKSIIKPKLESDITVVSDRFTDATYAYQHGGKGIDLKTIDLLKKSVDKLRSLSPLWDMYKEGIDLIEKFEGKSVYSLKLDVLHGVSQVLPLPV